MWHTFYTPCSTLVPTLRATAAYWYPFLTVLWNEVITVADIGKNIFYKILALICTLYECVLNSWLRVWIRVNCTGRKRKHAYIVFLRKSLKIRSSFLELETMHLAVVDLFFDNHRNFKRIAVLPFLSGYACWTNTKEWLLVILIGSCISRTRVIRKF